MRHAAASAAPWAVFIALVAILLGPSLTGDRVALPRDQLLAFSPWSASQPAEDPANPELRDVIDQYYPGQHALLGRLRSGKEAAWLPEVGLGYPGWAFVGWGALSPFNLPAAVLPFDLAWSWAMALRVFAAMAGTYVLARDLGVGRSGATVAGVAFGLSGYMVGWLGWPQSHVGAFVPWVWAAARLCARPARPWWAPAAVALTTAGLWLGGFPAVAVWGLLGAATLAAHAGWTHRGAGRRSVTVGAAAVAAGVVAGTALVAFTLLPTLEMLGQFDLGYREDMWRARVPLAALVTFAVPGYFGDVVNQPFWLPPAYVETVAYAGVVVLALAVPAWLLTSRRSGVWVVTALAVGFTAVAYGAEPLPRVIASLPVVSINPPPRALAVVALSLALLGGFGADALVRWVGGALRATRATAVGAVVLAVTGTAGWVAVRPARWLAAHAAKRIEDPADLAAALRVGQEEALLAAGLVGAAVILVVGARLVAVPWRALGTGIVAVGLVTLVAGDLGRFAVGWNPQVAREGLFPDAPALDELASASRRHRVAGSNRVGLPNTNLEYGIADLRARGFQTARQRAVLERLGARFTSQTLWGLDAADSARWEPWMTLLGVRMVVTPDWVDVLPGPREPDPGEQPSGPLSSTGVWVSLSAPRDGTVDGVQVRIGDFGRRNVGALVARVHTGGRTVTGRIGLRNLADGRPAMIKVRQVEVTAGSRVFVRLASDIRDGESGVAVFGVDTGARFEPVVGLRFTDDHGYERVDHGPVRLFENRRAPELVRAAGSARAVPAGQALEMLERLGPGELDSTVTVEVIGDAVLPDLPVGGRAEVTDWTVDGGRIRARVEAEDGAVLVALQEALDGWRAWLDGEPVDPVRVNHLFVGVVVPPGGGDVELRYVPAGLSTGVAVSVVAALSLLAGSVGARRRIRRAGRASSTAAQANVATARTATVTAKAGGQGDQASIDATPPL